MKEAVTKVIDTLTREDFHGAFHKLLERYNKYIAAGGDYFEGDYSFMCVLSIKVPIRKKSGNLSYMLSSIPIWYKWFAPIIWFQVFLYNINNFQQIYLIISFPVKMHLGLIAILPRDPEQEPRHRIYFDVLPRTLFLGWFLTPA